MKIFVDTSAFYAALTSEDSFHDKAKKILSVLQKKESALLTSNYVLLECVSLLQKRQNAVTAKSFFSDALKNLEVIWIDETLQKHATTLWLESKDRHLSLVDCTSFAVMLRNKLTHAITFDAHFSKNGFVIVSVD